MVDKDKTQITKEKIIGAATEIFSEKGFDGARVDEIAARAKVNKAMIYYYFENKENLFAELIRSYLKECDQIKAEIKSEIDWNKSIEVEKYFHKIEKFVNEKKDLLRIILVDAIKSDLKNINMADSFMPMIETRKEDLKDKGYSESEITEIIINRFFFVSMPLISFLTMGEKWAELLDLDIDIAKKSFIKLFTQFQCNYYNSIKK